MGDQVVEEHTQHLLPNTGTIAVLGTTGRQGSSVARALLRDGRYRVRGLSRNISKGKAQELISEGVEMIKGDATNADSLRLLFDGVVAVFAVTDYWDPSQQGREDKIGIMMSDIAKDCDVKHFVWSTLPNVRSITKGKYNVPHFSDKAKVDEHLRRIKLNHTLIAPAFFFQNFIDYGMLRRSDGSVILTLPTTSDTFITAVDVDDIGEVVKNIFINSNEWNGRWIPIQSVHQRVEDFAEQYSILTGEDVRFEMMERGKLGKEMQEMLDYFREYTYYGKNHDNFFLSRKLNPSLHDWNEFVKEGKARSS